ncbi:S-adenosyl-L-methionine-dependent methyltransferase [Dichotomocladium elegans]|nr:S-adenosyl-L-methionine-dependent methyltransferase [Dichotomocladium elegans]
MAAAIAVQSIPDPLPPRRKSITEFFTKRNTKVQLDDVREYDRLQRQHYLLKSARKANAWAPVDFSQPLTILDVGTGNGIWALEMAQREVHCNVIGLDVRVPLDHAIRPKNLRYVQADLHQQWPLESDSVDFIFQRNVSPEIQRNQWVSLYQEMMRVLKPGGLIEILEPDPTPHNPGPVQQAFEAFLHTKWDKANLSFDFAASIEDWLHETGFQLIETKTLDIPIGEWPEEPELKQFGFINMETQKLFFRNRKYEFSSQWGFSSEEYDRAVQDILEEFEEYHGFSRYHAWIAKKP